MRFVVDASKRSSTTATQCGSGPQSRKCDSRSQRYVTFASTWAQKAWAEASAEESDSEMWGAAQTESVQAYRKLIANKQD